MLISNHCRACFSILERIVGIETVALALGQDERNKVSVSSNGSLALRHQHRRPNPRQRVSFSILERIVGIETHRAALSKRCDL